MKECRVGQEENGEKTSGGSRGRRREDALWKRKKRGRTLGKKKERERA